MANLTIVYWRDIPAQVIAKEKRTAVKKPLSPRFIQAIDHAAMRAQKKDADAYLQEWRRDTNPCDLDLESVAEETINNLEESYSKERLLALVRNNGFEPSSDSN